MCSKFKGSSKFQYKGFVKVLRQNLIFFIGHWTALDIGHGEPLAARELLPRNKH